MGPCVLFYNLDSCNHVYSLFCWFFFAETLGNVDHGNQYQIKLMYEHHLQRTACNMTYGPFGGVKGKLFAAYCSSFVVYL